MIHVLYTINGDNSMKIEHQPMMPDTVVGLNSNKASFDAQPSMGFRLSDARRKALLCRQLHVNHS